jgi:cation transport regulator
MPFSTKTELPKSVKDSLPKHAQEIWKEAYNSAFEEYKDPSKRRGNAAREEVAAKVAWSAVKDKYEKSDDGKWHKK